MATKKIYDLAVKVGEYQDRNGNTKGRWLNVGRVLQKDDGGKFIMLDRTFNPAGVPDPDNRGTVLLSMFEPRDDEGGGGDGGAGERQQRREHRQQGQAGARQGGGPPPQRQQDPFPDDDIPF